MTQLTNDIYAIEAPEGAINFTIDMGYLIYKVPNYANWCNDSILSSPRKLNKYLETHTGKNDYKTAATQLPGSWQFICTTKEATEEQAAAIVESIASSMKYTYKDYMSPRANDFYGSAVDSLVSLFLSKGLDPVNKNYVLIKKIS